MTANSDRSRDSNFRPTASIEFLNRRAEVLKKVRAFFEENDFLEVETPLLSEDTVVDRYINPLKIAGSQLGVASLATNRFWLQTSPEFAMKRLLASGASAIFQIAKAFRTQERGRLHNPEFTILEWYRTGDDYDAGMDFLAAFAESIFDLPCQRTSYRTAFRRHAGIDGLSEDVQLFGAAAKRLKLDTTAIGTDDDVDAWRNLILSLGIESRLGADQPEILYDWPASQSALAMIDPRDPTVAQRFELYYQGIELANGYYELIDPSELMSRNEKVNQQRVKDGNVPLPNNSRLMSAMKAGLPKCCGVALGFDRLVMLITGADKIDDVIAFPIEHA